MNRGIETLVATARDLGKAASDLGRKASTAFDGSSDRVWSAEQVRFTDAAREAARRALYYARLLDPGAEEEEWAPFLLGHIRANLAAVVVPPRAECCPAEGGTGSECGFKGVRAPFDEILEDWLRICRLARVPDLSWSDEWGFTASVGANGATSGEGDAAHTEAERVRDLDERLVRFLGASIPTSRSLRITYVRIPALLHLVRQYAGSLVGMVFAAGIVIWIEAVHSLYLNDLGVTALCVAAATAVPVAMLAWVSRQRRKGRTPLWDRGGRLYRSMIPHPHQSEAWRERHPGEGASYRIMRGRAAAVAILLAGWAALGVIFVGLISLSWLDDVSLTVYLITILLLVLVALGSTLDFLDLHAQPPVRRSILIGLGFYLLGIVLFDSPAVGIAILVTWVGILMYWSSKISFERIRPVYLVMFGSIVMILVSTHYRRYFEIWRPVEARAEGETGPGAYWPPDSMIGTGLWPAGPRVGSGPPVVVIAASGGGSRAAIYTAMTLERLEADLPEVLANLQAIGSVSGGSLANAAYAARRAREAGLADGVACQTPLVEQMSGDFLRPVIFGVIPFFGGRGKAIESHWEQCPVGLGEIRMSDLARIWRQRVGAEGDTLPPFPVPVLHSASLLRHAVVLSPFAKEMYRPSGIDEEARGPENQYEILDTLGSPTWVFYRSGLYGLEDLLPGFDPKLSQAVRASANFPFGFPLVELRSFRPLYLSPWSSDRDSTRAKMVRLTDGGALSNSGVWSLYHLLRNQALNLRERGVLLLLVDVSGMPEPSNPNRVTGLMSAILDKNPKGEFLHRALLESLATTFGGCFDAVELEIRAIEEWNVHTTWALDGSSIEKLEHAFADEWRIEGSEIGRKFEGLRTCDPEGPRRWRGSSRVPIS